MNFSTLKLVKADSRQGSVKNRLHKTENRPPVLTFPSRSAIIKGVKDFINIFFISGDEIWKTLRKL